MERQIEEKINQQNEILRRALSTAIESENIGADTMNELAIQGEKMQKIDEKLDTIDENNYVANKYLNTIASITGYVTNIFVRKPKKFTPYDKSSKTEKNGQPSQQSQTYDNNLGAKDETDEIMNQLLISVRKQKEMARQMGNELNKQKGTIEGLSQHVDHTDNNIRKLNGKIARRL